MQFVAHSHVLPAGGCTQQVGGGGRGFGLDCDCFDHRLAITAYHNTVQVLLPASSIIIVIVCSSSVGIVHCHIL